ncbi:dihydrodipicolinate synthase family protein [Microbacterium sp. BWT-B31]|uniref:dihydrodipicolinate synthase family protein n=1 Tax=Microbacterium sp. BWT-B31 TaxID=3232072 RepID=UPI0035285E16
MSDVIGDRLIAAEPTPMRADESLDLAALESLVEADIARGVEGVYIGGSTGEGVLMSAQERAQLAAAASSAAAGRIPVYVHVGAMSTRESIEIADAAAQAGAAAISMIPPLYYKYSTDDVVAHFRAVIDAVDLPFVLYNIPQFTGRDVADGGFESILELPQVVGIKHTSQNLFGAERLMHRHPRLALINGFDELYLAVRALGARAAIGTTVGLQIDLFRSLRARADRGDLLGARVVQTRINDTVEAMVAVGVFAAAKYLGGKYAGELGVCRRPLPGLDAEGRRRLDAAWDRLVENVETTASEDASSAV